MIQQVKDGRITIIKTGTPVSGRVVLWSMMFYYKGLVIDCGCPNAANEVYNLLKTLGDIKAVLITHHHEDHIGCAHLLEREGHPIYGHSRSIPILRSPPRIPEYRRIVWGQPEPVNAMAIGNELEIDGIHISVYEAPGHSYDHVLYLIDDLLFIGDLIGSIKPKIGFYMDDYREILESVKKTVLNLDFSKAYGGHVILSKEDIQVFVEYLEDLRRRIIDLRKQGYSSDEIINMLWEEIPEKVYMMEAASGGEWHRKYLVNSLI